MRKQKKQTVFPKEQLSVRGNIEEFRLPDTPLGRLVASFHLVWGYVRFEGKHILQPCIYAPGLVDYPGFIPASVEQVYGKQ